MSPRQRIIKAFEDRGYECHTEWWNHRRNPWGKGNIPGEWIVRFNPPDPFGVTSVSYSTWRDVVGFAETLPDLTSGQHARAGLTLLPTDVSGYFIPSPAFHGLPADPPEPELTCPACGHGAHDCQCAGDDADDAVPEMLKALALAYEVCRSQCDPGHSLFGKKVRWELLAERFARTIVEATGEEATL